MPESSLGTVVILADERTERVSIWNNMERFCMLLRAVRSVDQVRQEGGKGGGSVG
jgi:hypothetical protein